MDEKAEPLIVSPKVENGNVAEKKTGEEIFRKIFMEDGLREILRARFEQSKTAVVAEHAEKFAERTIQDVFMGILDDADFREKLENVESVADVQEIKRSMTDLIDETEEFGFKYDKNGSEEYVELKSIQVKTLKNTLKNFIAAVDDSLLMKNEPTVDSGRATAKPVMEKRLEFSGWLEHLQEFKEQKMALLDNLRDSSVKIEPLEKYLAQLSPNPKAFTLEKQKQFESLKKEINHELEKKYTEVIVARKGKSPGPSVGVEGKGVVDKMKESVQMIYVEAVRGYVGEIVEHELVQKIKEDAFKQIAAEAYLADQVAIVIEQKEAVLKLTKVEIIELAKKIAKKAVDEFFKNKNS